MMSPVAGKRALFPSGRSTLALRRTKSIPAGGLDMQKRSCIAAFAVLFLTVSPAIAAPTTEQSMTSKSVGKLTPDEEKALLAPYRAKIDALDAQIVGLLGQRFDVIRDVAVLKAKHGIAPILPDRVEEVVSHARARAEKAGVDPKLVEQIYRIIIDTACQEEEDYARAQQAQIPPQAKPE
jgi:isochorismate pyruvate lyase